MLRTIRYFLILLLILNFLDGVLTFYGTQYMGFGESNIFMSYLLTYPIAFLLFKVVFISLLFCFFIRLTYNSEPEKISKKAYVVILGLATITSTGYMAVVLSWSFLIYTRL